MMKNTSKGKWIPGSLESLRKTHGCGYPFYCDTCERGFSNQSSLDKHNSTELHFKRLLKSKPELEPLHLTTGIQFGFDPLGDNEGLPSQRKRRNVQIKNYANRKVNDKKRNEGKIQCPTCYAHFDEQMMGKHLLSFFHCQKSEIEGRRVEPEKSLILEHIHSIVALSPYQCKPCSFYFTHRFQLLRHFEQNHVRYADTPTSGDPEAAGWICSACRSRGYDEIGMMNHLKNSPEHAKMEAAIQKSIPIIIRQIKLSNCDSCGRNFVLNRELLSHLETCSKRTPKEVTRESTFKSWKSSGNNTSTVELDNQISDSAISTVDSVKNEGAKETSHLLKNSLLSCKFCQFTTKSRANFSRHLKIHDESREKSFVCDICNAAFYEKYQRNYHMKIHTGKLIQCNYPGCEYTGRSNSEVNNHAITHEKDKQFECSECSYITKTKSHLARHYKLIHQLRDNSNKEFKCDQCSYTTNLPQGLKRHKLIHASSSTFFCPYCEYNSTSMDNIRIHVLKRKIHEGAVLYTCRLCKSGSPNFASNKFNVFKQHVVRHHPENPNSSTDVGIFVLAGLRKSACPSKDSLKKTTKNTKQGKVPLTQVEKVDFNKKCGSENTTSLPLELKNSLIAENTRSDSSGDRINFSRRCTYHNDHPYINCSYSSTVLAKEDSLIGISISNDKEPETEEQICDFFGDLLTDETIVSFG